MGVVKACTKHVSPQRSHRRRPIVWALLSLVWCYGVECHAQAEPGGFRDNAMRGALREEDLPAGLPLQHPLAEPTDPPAEGSLPRRGSGAPSLPEPTLPQLPLPAENEPDLAETRRTPEGNGEPTGLPPSDRVALRFVKEGRDILTVGEFERAQLLFERAVELAPFQPYSYYFLGRISFAQRKLQQALAFLQKAELLLPRTHTEWLGETICLRGQVAEDLGDIREARLAYQRCLHFAPNSLQALTALARLPQEAAPVSPSDLSQTNVFQTQADGAGNRDVLR